MNSISQCIFMMTTFVVCCIVYTFLIKTVFPLVLRLQYEGGALEDRGLKKYLYESGRAITYEPSPLFRKYVPSYALFTDCGYKYVCCKTDMAVEKLAYRVTMFDRRNRRIDTLVISEQLETLGKTSPIRLHSETSYVSIEVLSVNEAELENDSFLYCRWYFVLLYVVMNFLATFVQMYLLCYLFIGIFTFFGARSLLQPVFLGDLVFLSVGIAILISAIVLGRYLAKGIRVK